MKFLRKLFRRDAPSPPETWPPINEDWRVGDLAVCIIGGGWILHHTADIPRMGKTYRVANVHAGRLYSDNSPAWALALNGLFPGVGMTGYDARCFRKAIPDRE